MASTRIDPPSPATDRESRCVRTAPASRSSRTAVLRHGEGPGRAMRRRSPRHRSPRPRSRTRVEGHGAASSRARRSAPLQPGRSGGGRCRGHRRAQSWMTRARSRERACELTLCSRVWTSNERPAPQGEDHSETQRRAGAGSATEEPPYQATRSRPANTTRIPRGPRNVPRGSMPDAAAAPGQQRHPTTVPVSAREEDGEQQASASPGRRPASPPASSRPARGRRHPAASL